MPNVRRYYRNVVRRTLRLYSERIDKSSTQREREFYEYRLAVQCRDFASALRVPYAKLLFVTTGRNADFYLH